MNIEPHRAQAHLGGQVPLLLARAPAGGLGEAGAVVPQALSEMIALDPSVPVTDLLALLPHPAAPVMPEITMRGPSGQTRKLPGVFWPELALTGFQRPGRPLIGWWEIDEDDAVAYLTDWQHKLHLEGEPYERPYGSMFFLMEVMGRPAAVVALASSCNTWVSKKHGLSRYDCVDLARICRSLDHRDSYCLRAVLRLAREYLVPLYPLRYPKMWSTVKAVCANSMPDTDSARTDGRVSMYRFDGFERIRVTKTKRRGGGKRGKPSKAGTGTTSLWVYFYPNATAGEETVELAAVA
jgi:hypothetical protein